MRLLELSLAAALALSPGVREGCSDAEPRPLERVAFVGASMTAGLRTNTDLGRAFEASLAPPGAEVEVFAKRFFFSAPLENGRNLLAAALESEPTLVVAVDFLFWFGYGFGDGSGKLYGSDAERMATFEKGLELLDGVHCPLLVGDLPDMSRAVGRALLATQVPSAETIAAMNARLHEWVATREHAVVVPLAALVGDLDARRAVNIAGTTYPPAVIAHWLQRDRLHPTREGLVAVSTLIASALVDAGWGVTATRFEWDPEVVLARVHGYRAEPAAAR